MDDFFSPRFGRIVRLTRHALKSMAERHIDINTLTRVIETGDVKHKDDLHVWIYIHLDDRMDNLICAAAILADAIIVKTVMINWTLEEEK